MYYFFIVFFLLVIFVGYAFWSNRRKKAQAFPAKWRELLLEHVHFYTNLSKKEQQRFQQRMMLFLSEVYLESVGFELNDLDKVLIAASAVIPVFGFKTWHYTNLSTVLVYPDNFNQDLGFDQKDEKRNIGGLVGNGRYEKQMILSRKALLAGFTKNAQGHNTGIHEFVHLIDKADGTTDGVPERLIAHAYVIPWLKRIHKEMESINTNTSDIRNYAGTNEAEFLAVASEYFFEQPSLMKKKHPALYQMLQQCFQTNQKQRS